MVPDNKLQGEDETNDNGANNDTSKPPIYTPPPITPPPTIHEFEETQGRRWPMVVAFIILAFLVALAVVFAGRWLYNILTDKKPTPPPSNNVPAPPNNPNKPTTPAPAPTPTPTPTPQATQLPNNGPGSVLAIFVGTAVVIGGLHFLYNLRRQN